MAVTRTRAALAVQHENLGAHHVTDVLGISPSESFEVGDAYARDTLTREHSHWSLESDAPDDATLERQLRALVEVATPLRAALALLADEGYRLTWTCFVEEDGGDGSLTLSSALLADLGTFPVDLWFDSYAGAEQPA